MRVRDVGCTIFLLRVALETTCFLFNLGCALGWVLLLIFCRAQGVTEGDEDSVMFLGIYCWFYRAGRRYTDSFIAPSLVLPPSKTQLVE